MNSTTSNSMENEYRNAVIEYNKALTKLIALEEKYLRAKDVYEIENGGARLEAHLRENYVPIRDLMREKRMDCLTVLEHERWIYWVNYLLDNYTPENVKLWVEKLVTPYDELTEADKELHRTWAQKTAKIVEGELGVGNTDNVYLWHIDHPSFEYGGVAFALAESYEVARELVYAGVVKKYGPHPYFDDTFNEPPDESCDYDHLIKGEVYTFVAN